MNESKIKKVCVFGSYKSLGKSRNYDVVRLGRLLAESGFTVVSGGFGGTMEDVSRGAKSAGGRTIGITCYAWDKPLYKKANKFIDREIVAGSLLERVGLMLKQSDAFIVLPGGTGTLLELSAVLEHINKALVSPKPVIMLGNFWRPVLTTLGKEKIFSARARKQCEALYCSQLVVFAGTPDECIKRLKGLK
ncbi:MAG: LOG family protein [Candidatus Omnitrophica bacterium]|jgi:hypothetical protein|nr:LOG family protein [Candidatus Omnitrophota bacterium]MDD3274924.1 LOG family protein [Candidatus Omnitrophota bacterium]MDD5725529.1 LOG family protein [Candidatus Omnitrophota bacterium]